MAERPENTINLNPKQKLLRDLKDKFEMTVEAESTWRASKNHWERYYDGDQWTPEELAELRRRKQPAVVYNRIQPKINSLVGIHLQTKVRIKALPRGRRINPPGMNDEDKTDVISEALRYIEQNAKFEVQETEVFKEMAITGRGWFKHEIEFDGMDIDFKVESVDSDEVYLDPHSRLNDLSDAKFLFRAKWMDAEDVKEMFPRKVRRINEALNVQSELRSYFGHGPMTQYGLGDKYDAPGKPSNIFADKKRDRVRVIEAWLRKPVRKSFAVISGAEPIEITDMKRDEINELRESARSQRVRADGSVEDIDNMIVFEEIDYEIDSYKFIATDILETKKKVREDGRFPFVLAPCYRKRTGSRIPYGVVKNWIAAQDEINKRRSKMLNLLNNNQIYATTDAFEIPQEARDQANRPDGMILYRPGAEFRVDKNVELSQGQFQMLQESKAEIDTVAVAPELTGEPTSKESGRALQIRSRQAINPIRELFENMRQAKRQLAKLWLADMQKYWSQEKIIRVTDDTGAVRELVLNERTIDPQSGQIFIQNEIPLGKYDVILEEVPDTANLQNEQFEALVRLASNGMPIPPDLIIENSQLPNKTEILQKLAQSQQVAAQNRAQREQTAIQLEAQGIKGAGEILGLNK